MYFHFVDPDEVLARGAQTATDVDIIHSPKDGAIVAVAENHGVHVCWYCFEQFEENLVSDKRAVEARGGEWGTRILLHAKCVGKQKLSGNKNFFTDAIKNLQADKLIARVTRPFSKL